MSSFNYPSDVPDEPSPLIPPEDPTEIDDPEDTEPVEGADARLRMEDDDPVSERVRARHRAEPDGSDPGIDAS